MTCGAQRKAAQARRGPGVWVAQLPCFCATMLYMWNVLVNTQASLGVGYMTTHTAKRPYSTLRHVPCGMAQAEAVRRVAGSEESEGVARSGVGLQPRF